MGTQSSAHPVRNACWQSVDRQDLPTNCGVETGDTADWRCHEMQRSSCLQSWGCPPMMQTSFREFLAWNGLSPRSQVRHVKTPLSMEAAMTEKPPPFWRLAVLLSLAISVASASLLAGAVMLQPQVVLQGGTGPIAPGIQAIPCAADWNGDGRRDLLVGYRNTDKIAFYANSGTDTQPLFTGFSNLQAGGSDIVQPGAGCGAPAPWACDFNGDGRRDLLVGNGANGQVFFYANTHTDASPVLAEGAALEAGGAVLSVGARATPFVCDWDDDGVPDLLCGDGSGYANFFRNEGTRQAPSFAAAVRLKAGGLDVNFGARSALRVVDWDGDGREDLVGSGSGYAGWCRNVGAHGAPGLEPPQALTAPVNGVGLAPVNTSYRMRLEVADWNNDGVLDLLIGDAAGGVLLYEGYQFAVTSLVVDPGQPVSVQWNSAEFLQYDLLAGHTPDAIGTVIAAGVSSGGSTTTWTHGPPAARQFYRVRLAR